MVRLAVYPQECCSRQLVLGDEAALSLWRKWRDLSIDAYSAQYSSLNIHFDEYVGESEVDKQTLAQVLSSLTAKGLIIEEDGAKLVNLEEWGLGKPVLLKRGGFSFHSTKTTETEFRWK
jgi:arginyl-tRNA synthetase